MVAGTGISPAFLTPAVLHCHLVIRDWSLITGRRGGYKTGGGACEVLPLRKGGGGGQNKF